MVLGYNKYNVLTNVLNYLPNMKICFIGNLSSIHTIRWIQPVIDAKHEVYVVSYRKNILPLSGAKEIIDLESNLNIRKIRFVLWGIWLRSYLQKIQPDILHAHQIPAAGWLGTMTGFHPFVITGWGSDLLMEYRKSLFRKMLIKVVLTHTDFLTVPSKIMYNAALNLGYPKEKLHLIPWGIETNIFKPDHNQGLETRKNLKLDERIPVILCPRGIDPIYNLDIALDACHSILSDFPDLRLLLLRYNINPNYLKTLEHKITSYRMEANVIWLPAQISFDDMACLYQTSDVVLSIPSSEGYGFSVYEAMACGIPTIISDLPVFEDDLHDRLHVIKVPVRDINKTALALENALKDMRLRQTLIQNGLIRCIDMSVQNRITQVEGFYQYIMKCM